ncbi:MAG: hypothetical protein WDN49_02645 [Acetobacteraceae bacterium]
MPACALCGTPAPSPYRAPPPEMAPDLDMRPGEPARSTLPRWIALCRGCGACAPDLAALPPAAAAITGSARYRAIPSRFLRWAALVAGTPDEAEALLQAAWSADDRGEDGSDLRRRAAAVWPEPRDAEQGLRLVDVLRRAGAFDAAAARLPALMDAADETSRRIASFQQARIAARDTGRYLLSSALPPPAHMPHVARGKPAAQGFWGRLFNGQAR